MRRKSVRQEDSMGCAVACVAFALGAEYKIALKFFLNGQKKAKTTGFSPKEINNALKNAQKSYDRRYVKSHLKNKTYQNGSIIYMKRSDKYPYGHYVARWDGKWMDPWINFPKEPRKSGFKKRLPEKSIYVIFKT